MTEALLPDFWSFPVAMFAEVLPQQSDTLGRELECIRMDSQVPDQALPLITNPKLCLSKNMLPHRVEREQTHAEAVC